MVGFLKHLLFYPLVSAALSSATGLGIHFENENQESALLKLDYATYRGVYNATNDVYVFKNIRFAAPPLGNLRWAKPAVPLNTTEIQDGSAGRSCTQSGSAGRSPLPGPSTAGEDCLFLDLTVPSKAIKDPSLKLPVMAWYYGGAYVVGSKEQRGGAEAFIKAAEGNLIWVAGNYRLGAYGFLTGTTVEKEAVPNAGFWDQRAVLEWIQKNIALVGGDSKTVTAMGISAGAGSILHHLIFEGGKLDPLFKRAIIQSPGYTNFQARQDRPGKLEQSYKRFEDLAGCAGKGIACLRTLNETALKDASDKANSGQTQGSFAFGPAPDGSLIEKAPVLHFDSGRYWKGIESIISSHVTNEGGTFIDRSITNDAGFDAMILRSYGNRSELAPFREKVIKQLYPPVGTAGSNYKSITDRLTQYASEMSFTCHNRLLADAYPGKTYSVQYAVPPGGHGSDQAGTFFNSLAPQNAGLSKSDVEGRLAFQSYLASFAVTGDPNKKRNKAATIEWPLTTGEKDVTLSNVLNVASLTGSSGLSLIKDDQQVKDRCSYYTDLAKAMDNLA
ncbi:alpha/beta-hydrolase [Tothia fuscella]|uniref:Alpha/beta-hydrolase n=1 Tax=Tothia fuscella TaxID=1048955 RepID=A0A9P4NIR5_9PEZI|nr:alpha/beta-hydrolase [Tothia fuscella]